MWPRITLTSFLLLLAGVSWAEDPPEKSLRQFIDFKKSVGILDYFPSDNIPDEAAQSSNNIDHTLNGVLSRRRALAHTLSADLHWGNESGHGEITSGYRNDHFWLYPSTITPGKIQFIGRIGTKIYGVDETRSLAIDAQIGPLVTVGQQYGGIADGGHFYVVAPSTNMLKITETGGAPFYYNARYLQAPPPGNIFKSHLDRFLITGSSKTGFGMTVYFSSSDLIESWPAENFFEVIGGAEEYITCIGDPLFGNLPLYTNKAVRLVTGSEYPDDENPGNINVRLIYSGIGCVSQKSVKNMNNTQYFFSGGQGGNVPGIYAFNGVSVKEKTKPLRTFFRDMVKRSTDTAPKAASFVYQDNYCLSVVTVTVKSTTTNTTVCIDTNDRITMYRPFHFDDSAEFNDNVYLEVDTWAMGNPVPADIVRREVLTVGRGALRDVFYPGSINGIPLEAAVPWAYKTKDFDLGDAARQKSPERAYIKTSASTGAFVLTVQANYDFGKSSTTWTIDLSTFKATASSGTWSVVRSTDSMVTKLLFPTGAKPLDFNNINFEVSSSSDIAIDYIDLYVNKRPLK